MDLIINDNFKYDCLCFVKENKILLQINNLKLFRCDLNLNFELIEMIKSELIYENKFFENNRFRFTKNEQNKIEDVVIQSKNKIIDQNFNEIYLFEDFEININELFSKKYLETYEYRIISDKHIFRFQNGIKNDIEMNYFNQYLKSEHLKFEFSNNPFIDIQYDQKNQLIFNWITNQVTNYCSIEQDEYIQYYTKSNNILKIIPLNNYNFAILTQNNIIISNQSLNIIGVFYHNLNPENSIEFSIQYNKLYLYSNEYIKIYEINELLHSKKNELFGFNMTKFIFYESIYKIDKLFLFEDQFIQISKDRICIRLFKQDTAVLNPLEFDKLEDKIKVKLNLNLTEDQGSVRDMKLKRKKYNSEKSKKFYNKCKKSEKVSNKKLQKRNEIIKNKIIDPYEDLTLKYELFI